MRARGEECAGPVNYRCYGDVSREEENTGEQVVKKT